MRPFRALRATAIHTYAKTLEYLGRIPGMRILWRLIPVEEAIWPRSKTTRLIYEIERQEYRAAHLLIRSNEPLLTRREYYFYRNLALKYRWPYLKEAYDDDEAASYHEPIWQLLEHLTWWQKFSTSMWRLSAIITVIALGNMAVESNFTSLGQRMFSMFIFFVDFQLFVLVLLLPARCVARIQVIVRNRKS